MRWLVSWLVQVRQFPTQLNKMNWSRGTRGIEPEASSSKPSPRVETWLANQPPMELGNISMAERGQPVDASTAAAAHQKKAAASDPFKLWYQDFDIDVKEWFIDSRPFEPKVVDKYSRHGRRRRQRDPQNEVGLVESEFGCRRRTWTSCTHSSHRR